MVTFLAIHKFFFIQHITTHAITDESLVKIFLDGIKGLDSTCFPSVEENVERDKLTSKSICIFGKKLIHTHRIIIYVIYSTNP